MERSINEVLQAFKEGRMSLAEAEAFFAQPAVADIGFANIDLQRSARQGTNEVIYGAGKTAEQISGIAKEMLAHQQNDFLITRLDPEKAEAVKGSIPLHYVADGQIAYVGSKRPADGLGEILIVSAGTSDLPVATEAAVTAEFYGNAVTVLTDVGVAGLHRLLSHLDTLRSAGVIIVVAGMEGALASVVGGLVDCPVIAVPTSVGYGASFKGMTALLSMMNSCATGISVVNIDNGFGAAFLAHRINHMHAKKTEIKQ